MRELGPQAVIDEHIKAFLTVIDNINGLRQGLIQNVAVNQLTHNTKVSTIILLFQ